MRCTLDKTYGESWCKTINCHDLLYCMDSQSWEDIDLWWDLKVVIYPYGLDHCWWKLVAIGILNKGTMISYVIETVCLLGLSKGHVIIKFLATVIPLVEFDICSLELEYVIWSHNRRICNSRIVKIVLKGW